METNWELEIVGNGMLLELRCCDGFVIYVERAIGVELKLSVTKDTDILWHQ